MTSDHLILCDVGSARGLKIQYAVNVQLPGEYAVYIHTYLEYAE